MLLPTPVCLPLRPRQASLTWGTQRNQQRHAKRHYNDEAVQFWIHSRAYELAHPLTKDPSATIDDMTKALLQGQARAVFHRFVAPGSVLEVSVASAVRDRIESLLDEVTAQQQCWV